MKRYIWFLILFSLNAFAYIPRPTNIITDFFNERISGCSETEKDLIYEAEKLISQRLDEILMEWSMLDLAGVKQVFINPEKRQWISGDKNHQMYQTYWEEMKNVFQMMRAKVDKSLNFKCKDGQSNQCIQGSVAYVMVLFGYTRKVIYLCPDFFYGGSHLTTLFHELSHYAAFTKDGMLSWIGANILDLKQAPMDAYHVESFMTADIRTVLRRDIWSSLWPKIKQ